MFELQLTCWSIPATVSSYISCIRYMSYTYLISAMGDSIRKKALEDKIRIKMEAYKNMEEVRKYSTEDLQAKIKETSMVTFLNSLYSGKVKATKPKQATLSRRGYMAELYDPFSEEFTNWLFQHLQKCYKDKCSSQIINTVLEPECIKKLYSEMFQTSGRHTDDLLYESAVLASEFDQGISFEDTLKSLRKGLDPGSESSPESNIENLETNEKKIALALFDFSGKRKNQMSFKKEDLMLLVKTSEKWLYAEKGGERGWVPHNYVCILDDIKGEKQAKKDYHWDENNSLSFSKGDQIKIFKEKMGWGIGKVNDKYGYFPLKYVCD